MAQGTLYIVSAPSGAGKSSLIQALLKTQPLYDTQVSVSHTTRAPRPGEVHGEHYFFVNHDEFRTMIGRDAFLEHAEVFGNYYGTSKRWTDEKLAAGYDVLLEIDWQGAQQVRKGFPQAIGIFIMPPTISELEKRLSARATDSQETIAHRLAAARDEMCHVNEFEYVIINEDLHQAFNGLSSIVNASRLRFGTQCKKFPELFKAFESFERE